MKIICNRPKFANFFSPHMAWKLCELWELIMGKSHTGLSLYYLRNRKYFVDYTHHSSHHHFDLKRTIYTQNEPWIVQNSVLRSKSFRRAEHYTIVRVVTGRRGASDVNDVYGAWPGSRATYHRAENSRRHIVMNGWHVTDGTMRIFICYEDIVYRVLATITLITERLESKCNRLLRVLA